MGISYLQTSFDDCVIAGRVERSIKMACLSKEVHKRMSVVCVIVNEHEINSHIFDMGYGVENCGVWSHRQVGIDVNPNSDRLRSAVEFPSSVADIKKGKKDKEKYSIYSLDTGRNCGVWSHRRVGIGVNATCDHLRSAVAEDLSSVVCVIVKKAKRTRRIKVCCLIGGWG
jgi:hypothetical protein